MTEFETQFEKLKSLLGEAMLEIALLRLEKTNLERTLAVYCQVLARPSFKQRRTTIRKALRRKGLPVLPFKRAS